MGNYNNFRESRFLHEQAESREEELGVGATIEDEFWSAFGGED
jgi:hypothetical protein